MPPRTGRLEVSPRRREERRRLLFAWPVAELREPLARLLRVDLRLRGVVGRRERARGHEVRAGDAIDVRRSRPAQEHERPFGELARVIALAARHLEARVLEERTAQEGGRIDRLR